MSVKSLKMIGPFWPYRGGLATYNERLAREFISLGYQLSLETFTLQYPGILFPGKSQYDDRPAPSDLTIRRTVNAVNPLNWLMTGRRIANEKPDLLLVRYWLPFMAPSLGSICRMARKNRHTRVVCLADNIVPHEKRAGDQILTRYFMKSIDGMVAMSQSVLNDIDQFNPGLPRALCHHPLYDSFGEKVDTAEAKKRLGLDPKTSYLLFFGFIREYKGLDLLLKAMADERLTNLPVKLIVAGEFYSSPEPALNLIEKLNLHDKVILHTHFIPDNQVNLYFSAADLIVQPYKSATQSGVTQIGYHFEKAMLVTNVGGLPEIVPHGRIGYVVEPDERAIADALDDFYRNSRQAAFEQNIAAEKKKFSWTNLASAFLDVYAQLGKNPESDPSR